MKVKQNEVPESYPVESEAKQNPDLQQDKKELSWENKCKNLEKKIIAFVDQITEDKARAETIAKQSVNTPEEAFNQQQAIGKHEAFKSVMYNIKVNGLFKSK